MRQLRTVLLLFAMLMLLVGGVYPMAVTAVARWVFPSQAEGSLVRDGGGRVIGSKLIGQPFSSPAYFWPRPSATQDFPYNPMASGGSQLGPTNPDLKEQIAGRIAAFRQSGIEGPIPSDLVMTSGSGLDPHVTLDAALAQVPRVAKARGMEEAALRVVVTAHREGRELGCLGKERVNVLVLNLDLDAMEERGHGEE
jgi:potassium-transporting ATPase KdpC subunit